MVNRKTYAILGLFCLIALSVVLHRVLDRPRVEPVELKLVTIKEGMTTLGVSRLLRENSVFVRGEVIPREFEGYIFPDTYEFYAPSSLSFVLRKIGANFEDKASAVFDDRNDMREMLTLASLIEREVPDSNDRKIVSGIIKKRIRNGMLLQVDSSICYIKPEPCHPVKGGDLKIDSRYNTYLYKGLPPGPISNPGLDAIQAALNHKDSSYWFYISDPRTKRTIFSSTLDEHNINVAKYLRRNY